MKLPASMAHIWADPDGCRAWGLMQDQVSIEYSDDEVRLEGIAAHDLAYVAMTNGKFDIMNAVDKIHENGSVYTHAMCLHVVDYVNFLKGDFEVNDLHGVETENLEYHPLVKVRPDAWSYSKTHEALHVIDFKYGFTKVSPFKNLTLAIYAMTLQRYLELPIQTIRFTIYQPRAHDSISTATFWELSGDDLLELIDIVDQAIIAAQNNPQCKAGTYCTKCDARYMCSAAQQACEAAFDYSATPEARNLFSDQIGYELDMIDRAESALKARRTGLEEVAKISIQSGNLINGYTVKPGRTNLAWDKEKKENAMLIAETLGYNIKKPEALITPTQAKNLGFPESILDGLTYRPPGKLKLTKIDLKQSQLTFKDKK